MDICFNTQVCTQLISTRPVFPMATRPHTTRQKLQGARAGRSRPLHRVDRQREGIFPNGGGGDSDGGCGGSGDGGGEMMMVVMVMVW